MQIHKNADLKGFHTFAVDAECTALIEIDSIEELITAFQADELRALPKLILGKGSNVLFTQRYQGAVLINRMMGRTVVESEQHVHLHINAGEDWPETVKWSLDNRYSGLENLAMIPGCVGSSPIQNIGAYGVELKDVCEYVEYLCLESLRIKRIANADCKFGYRDSIFKGDLKDKAIITAVGIVLDKTWVPKVNYGGLRDIPSDELSPMKVYETVCHIRQSKLPDPAKQGNAGSFFKNPVISNADFYALKMKYPTIVGYETESGVKVAAGWLIDSAKLKGVSIGGAQVHVDQALVIINSGDATAQDILMLAKKVRQSVLDLYGIELEHEVRFIGAKTETTLDQWIKQA